MPVNRELILDGALRMLDAGHSVSLQSVAEQVQLTKPGLMHYFPSKQSLMLALVDHVVDRWERNLRARLGTGPDQATPRERMIAYLDWSLSGQFGGADLVMLADPRLREPLRERFTSRLQPWLRWSTRLPAAERARLTAVRLISDGAWFAEASMIQPLTATERRATKLVALSLLDDG